MMTLKPLCALLVVAAGTAACSPYIRSTSTETLENVRCGEAMWVGEERRGRPTASGAKFDPDKLTASHRTLPFGTVIRVFHGGNRADLRVVDRGPKFGGRTLDVSKAAAAKLDFIEDRAAKVCFVVVKRAPKRMSSPRRSVRPPQCSEVCRPVRKK